MDKQVLICPYDVINSVIKRNESLLHVCEFWKDSAELKKPDRKLYTFILKVFSLLYFNYTSLNFLIYFYKYN